MKTGLRFLLIVSFGGLADALQCYECTSSNSNTQCNQNIKNCSMYDDTCMTTITHVVGIQSITKTCTTSSMCTAATSTNIDLYIGGNSVTCCKTDLCNVNGFTVTRLNILLLSVPAALLLLSPGTS